MKKVSNIVKSFKNIEKKEKKQFIIIHYTFA